MREAIDGNLMGRVSVELMEGSDPSNMATVTTIAENISAGNMQMKWSVPKNLKASNNYAIKIVDDGGDEYYGQYFKGVGGHVDVSKKTDRHTTSPSPASQARDSKDAKHVDSNDASSSKTPAFGKDATSNAMVESKPMKDAKDAAKDGEGVARKNAAGSVSLGSAAAAACVAAAFGAIAIC
ncbi:hypothetical protein GGI04_000030 [Coemansia thaxteri]|nr:hypothetical protein GGI04_000030 [Coemansia thaxteri]